MASPTAKYNEPKSVFDAPCDVAFLCAMPNELTADGAAALAAAGCKTVVDGGYRPVSSAACKVGVRTIVAFFLFDLCRAYGHTVHDGIID